MSAWESRIEQLLYEGEEIRVQVGGEDVQVVVTTHRVLAFQPEDEGPKFRAVDLPNVTSVGRTTTGATEWLVRGGKWLVVGVALLAAGIIADFEGMLIGPDLQEGIGQVGLGGILGLFSLLRTFFALIDDALLLGGLAATVAGLAGIGWYLYTRQESVRIAVAGEEDILLPARSLSGPAIAKVAEATEPRERSIQTP
jgi:hypothetical protein